MSSTNYQIDWDSVGTGGDDTSSSSSFILRDSVGGLSGSASSASYGENSGYRAGVYDETVSYEVFTEDVNTQVAATSLSGNSVFVTSTSGFAVGDMIAVVQNEGPLQVVAIGRMIDEVNGVEIVVDEFHDDGTAPVIDGLNDFVYNLSEDTLSLPSLSPVTISTGVIGWHVDAEVDQGYSVYALADHGLAQGSETIADVADGSVTIGSSEYGARSSDTSLAASTFDTQDTGFGTTPVQIASRSGAGFAQRDFLNLKAAVDQGQASGAYSQNLTLIFVGDY